MGKSIKVSCLLLLAIIAFSMLASHVSAASRGRNPYGPNSLKPAQCQPKCDKRCSDTGYRNACMEFCLKCCKKCLCVPPGTYGNKVFCPCYDNWKTQQGGPKCP